jgi:hypothetical protein
MAVPPGSPPTWLPGVTTAPAMIRPRSSMLVPKPGSSVHQRGDDTVGCGDVAVDIDAVGGQDLAVLMQVDVVADQQQHRTLLGEDLSARHDARRIRVVAGRGRVVFGKPGRSRVEQFEVLALNAESRTVMRMSPV